MQINVTMHQDAKGPGQCFWRSTSHLARRHKEVTAFWVGNQDLRIRSRIRTMVLCICFAYVACVLRAAESPTFIPFQGRITDQTGTIYTNGQYTIHFQLYNQAVGGQAIWQERHDKVGVLNGLVNVFLGSINPLTTVDFSSTRHLGITIDADNIPNTPEPEMIPRQMIIPAFWAKNSEKLAGQDWTPLFGTNSPLGALPAAKIQSRGITEAQIAPGAVGASEIAREGVLSANIGDGQITAAKLAPELTRDAVIPAGTIQAFGGSKIPQGWLLCNGEALSSAEFPRLYNAISTNWGGGYKLVGINSWQKSGDFNLPDLRGTFLRGVNGGRTSDLSDPDANARINPIPGGSVGDNPGSFQSDGIPNISGQANSEPDAVAFFRNGSGQATGPFYIGPTVRNTIAYDPSIVGNRLGFDASRCSSKYGASPNEVRPKNASVNYIIKF